jgi:hypothetical protein
MAGTVESVPISKMDILECVDLIIDNLKIVRQLSIPNELSINIVSIIIGSFVNKADFDNPSPEYARNHECPAFVNNLLQNPETQISPALLEHIRQNNIDTININQYILLVDPMYSRPEYGVPYGLTSVYPSLMVKPILSTNGFITQDDLLPAPIKYNSILEPYIIPYNTNEPDVSRIIEQFQQVSNGNLLINLMDCSSNTLRRMWMQNTAPNIYLAMPDCLAKDNTPMYMPIITYDSKSSSLRWINWTLDKDFVLLFQLISPHTYQFLIHNYKCLVLEAYFIPICKILGRMRITLNYKLDDNKSIVFSEMCFQEFKNLWINKRARFEPLFISFMDEYYKWNYYKFIDILLQTHSNSEEPSMQKILLSYLEEHLKQLKAFFPSEPIPEYVDDDRLIQSSITKYLNANDIH